jgi:monoamine oxidase
VYLLPGPTSDLNLVGYSDETFHVLGGNDQIPKAVAAHLPAAAVQLNHVLTKVAVRNSTVLLTFTTPSGTRLVEADYAVLAVPFSILRSGVDYSSAGFDSLKQTAITSLGYGSNAKLHLLFQDRMWNQKGPWGISNGTVYGSDFQNTYEPSRGQPGPMGVLVNYRGSTGTKYVPTVGDYEETPLAEVEGWAQDFLGQFEPVFPGISQKYTQNAAIHVPLVDPFLLGSYSYWQPGQYTQFSGSERACQGPIGFAGEHCSTNFQGYMEGAASEGLRAANELLGFLNLTVNPDAGV